MQFHIVGRFSAEVQWENDAWTVRPAAPHVHPAARDASAQVGLAGDDLADFLEEIVLEAIGPDPK
jgi:hypothetical protein